MKITRSVHLIKFIAHTIRVFQAAHRACQARSRVQFDNGRRRYPAVLETSQFHEGRSSRRTTLKLTLDQRNVEHTDQNDNDDGAHSWYDAAVFPSDAHRWTGTRFGGAKSGPGWSCFSLHRHFLYFVILLKGGPLYTIR